MAKAGSHPTGGLVELRALCWSNDPSVEGVLPGSCGGGPTSSDDGKHEGAFPAGTKGRNAAEHVGVTLVEGSGDKAGGLQAGDVKVAGEIACEGGQGVGDRAAPREEALVLRVVLPSAWWLALSLAW